MKIDAREKIWRKFMPKKLIEKKRFYRKIIISDIFSKLV